MKSLTKFPAAKWLVPLTLVLFLFISCQKEIGKEAQSEARSGAVPSTPTASLESADVAIDWYKLQLRILLERNSAFNGGAYFGYVGIALYESVRHGLKNSVSLSTKLYQMPAMPARENNNGYNWKVSANAAMASMVRSLYAGLTAANMASIDSLENAYNNKIRPGVESATFQRSQSFGKAIATAIFNWYKTDNFNGSNVGYVLPPAFPGSWVPTPPAFVNPVNPFISAARPFLPEHATMIGTPFSIPYSEDPSSAFYQMEKHVYDVSKTLTDEQKNIALFWVDQGNGVGYTPPGHDMSIVIQTLEQAGASLGLAAEALAKAGIAERDASLVVFRTKYANMLIRPVSYIRNVIDADWLPFIPTPPHPEYPAAHAGVTGSALQAAARVIGENVPVTDHTYDFRGYPTRTYSSIFAAAEEAGISRLYGGIHYLVSINAGLDIAHEIGNRVGDIKLHD